jgi:hypothetical protein
MGNNLPHQKIQHSDLKKNGLHDHLVSRPFPLVIVVVVVMKLIPGHQFIDVQLT